MLCCAGQVGVKISADLSSANSLKQIFDVIYVETTTELHNPSSMTTR